MSKFLVLKWIEKRQLSRCTISQREYNSILFLFSRRFKIDIMLLFNKVPLQTSPVTSILFLTAKFFLQSRITCYI
uniref:PRO1776 n=1 Tax=Homo sapiens TaxID=9606 RepID=Q9P193_HUMAN|nr:PRO1776 [Homo sapiens]